MEKWLVNRGWWLVAGEEEEDQKELPQVPCWVFVSTFRDRHSTSPTPSQPHFRHKPLRLNEIFSV